MHPQHPSGMPDIVRPVSWFRRVATLVLISTGMALLVSMTLGFGAHAGAAGQNSATVVIQYGDQSRTVRTVRFSDPISGLRALELSGIEFISVSTSFGPAVCSINRVGCPAEDCFCSATHYWGYSFWDGVGWQSYRVGAGSSVISQTGAIEGWVWGAFGDPQVSPASTLAAERGLAWLAAGQVITTGGYGSTGGAVETLLAIGANGMAGRDWRRTPGAPSLEEALLDGAAGYSRSSAAAAGKLGVALAGADACVPPGVVTPAFHYSATLGSFGANTGDNAWAILGTVALSETLPTPAVTALRAAAQGNGGWEWGVGWGADTNATALAIQALMAAGEPPTATLVMAGLDYLKATQNADGGFPYAPSAGGQPAAESDANSTAYVMQAILAAGHDPAGAPWQQSGQSSIDYLLARQLDDGSFEWKAGTGANQLATQQAAPALLGHAHPVAMRTPAACPAVYLPAVTAAP